MYIRRTYIYVPTYTYDAGWKRYISEEAATLLEFTMFFTDLRGVRGGALVRLKSQSRWCMCSQARSTSLRI